MGGEEALPPLRGRHLSGAEPDAAAARRRGIRNGVGLGLLVLGVAVALNWSEWAGVGDVLATLPLGVVLASAVHLPQIVLTAAAWRALLPAGARPSLTAMTVLRWYREAANALLPAGGLVGQAAAARLLARQGVPPLAAGASATVDLTIEAVSQLVFTLAGVALLILGGDAAGLGGIALGGAGLAAAGAIAMVALQRRLPQATLERAMVWAAGRIPGVGPGWVAGFAAALRELHAERARLAWGFLWHLVAWIIGAFEIQLVLGLAGVEIGFAEALVVESIAQALRNAGVLLPGAVAVQEGAIIGAAALVGVGAGPALTVALVRRAREVAFGLPGLLAWQRAELRAGEAAHARPAGALDGPAR